MRAAVYESGKPDLILDDVDIEDRAPSLGVRGAPLRDSPLRLHQAAQHLRRGSPVLGHEAAGCRRRDRGGGHDVAPRDTAAYVDVSAVAATASARTNPAPGITSQGMALLDGFQSVRRAVSRCIALGAGVRLSGPNTRRPRETGAVKVPPDTPLETAQATGCAVQTGVGAVLNTAKVGFPGAAAAKPGGIGLQCRVSRARRSSG